MKKPGRRSILKWLLLAIGLMIALLAAAVAVMVGPYWSRVDHVAARPADGFHSDYYLYVSRGARSAAVRGERVTLLVQPNNSGTVSDDAQVHLDDAWWTGWERHRLANELGVALLVPAFPRPASEWKTYTHALDRDVFSTERKDLARLDLQLISMVDDARATLLRDGVDVDDRFLIQGFSASGMFANRFAALHPDRVKAVSAGSPGGWPIAPVERVGTEPLPYPAGVADFEALTGKPFNLDAYRSVPQLLVLGSRDDNDSVDFRDGWDEAPAAQVERLFGATPVDRWDDAENLYRAAGANGQFLLVEGIAHDRRSLQPHTTAFFKEVLAAERGR